MKVEKQMEIFRSECIQGQFCSQVRYHYETKNHLGDTQGNIPNIYHGGKKKQANYPLWTRIQVKLLSFLNRRALQFLKGWWHSYVIHNLFPSCLPPKFRSWHFISYSVRASAVPKQSLKAHLLIAVFKKLSPVLKVRVKAPTLCTPDFPWKK